MPCFSWYSFFFFQAEDGIRDIGVTGVQTCALPISTPSEILSLGDSFWLSVALLLGLSMVLYLTGREKKKEERKTLDAGPDGSKTNSKLYMSTPPDRKSVV